MLFDSTLVNSTFMDDGVDRKDGLAPGNLRCAVGHVVAFSHATTGPTLHAGCHAVHARLHSGQCVSNSSSTPLACQHNFPQALTLWGGMAFVAFNDLIATAWRRSTNPKRSGHALSLVRNALLVTVLVDYYLEVGRLGNRHAVVWTLWSNASAKSSRFGWVSAYIPSGL